MYISPFSYTSVSLCNVTFITLQLLLFIVFYYNILHFLVMRYHVVVTYAPNLH